MLSDVEVFVFRRYILGYWFVVHAPCSSWADAELLAATNGWILDGVLIGTVPVWFPGWMVRLWFGRMAKKINVCNVVKDIVEDKE